ncbi:carboxypeptidase-like regulatory domain-containing protein [Hymenobacter coalescens]
MLPSVIALLLSAIGALPVHACDGAPAKTAAPPRTALKAAGKAPAAKKAALTTVRLKPAPVAPTKDVLNEHFAVTVVGSITDPNGQPLPGATVWKTNSREVLAVANSQGDFSLSLPTNASIALTCGYVGFIEQQLDLRQPRRLNQFVVNLLPLPARYR